MQRLATDPLSQNPIPVQASVVRRSRIGLGRLLWAGPLTVAAAVAATLAGWAVAVTMLPPIAPAFVELQAKSIAIVSSVLCAAAVLVFALVTRLARHPLATFRIVAAVALGLSWLPDLALLSQPGGTAGNVAALMVLHAIAAAAVIGALSILTADA